MAGAGANRRVALGLALLAASIFACTQAPSAHGESWPEADQLFRNDPLWLGSDGAYSCDLGEGRVLWAFGDTLIARDASRDRNTAYFIRNSFAIETGYDPSQAFIQFYWGRTDGHPDSFLPQQGENWFWPAACARVGRGVILFAQRLAQDGPPGPFSFKGVGSEAFFIDDADAPPSSWQPRDAHAPDVGRQLGLGTAATVQGDYLYAYGASQGVSHDYYVARFALVDAAQGDLSKGELYGGGQWVSASTLKSLPQPLFTLGAPESSVHWEPRVGRFLMTQTEGFGASTLDFRSAPAPEGPWTDPREFFRPPESNGPDAFVYAGKGHPELTGADFVVTYFPGTFSGQSPANEPDDYYPRFVKVTF